jgi:DNA-binding winged helix-turn-helix (wHTH) protein
MSPTGEVEESMRSFRVGEWTVEPSLNRVSRGSAAVQLDFKAMELLVFFADNAGRLLSRRELVESVWRGDAIAAGTLTHAIAGVRRALGDDPATAAYIETIPKRGYRLVAPVTFQWTDDRKGPKRGPRCRLEACDVGFALIEGENLIGRDATAHVRID